MDIKVNKEAFKSQAKRQHSALVARSIDVKLSDVQESLAVAYGFTNLATLYAKFNSEMYSVVDATVQKAQKENLFVLSWFFDDQGDQCAEDVMGIYPPGTTLDDVASYDWKKAEALNDAALLIPEGFTFSPETLVLENYATVPSIARYGLYDAVKKETVCAWVHEFLGFRVPTTGVEISLHDTGDDSGNKDHLLVWLTDEDAAQVRAWFADPPQ